MIRIAEKKDCCGCGACEAACPRRCIKMAEDGEGFSYPEADAAVCVGCGACEAVCPVLSRYREGGGNCMDPTRAFLARNRDEEILRESTSGGAFSAIAAWAIRRGGVAYGAAFGADGEVAHAAAYTEGELSGFRNSKYVQSRVGDAYARARKDLLAGRWVCFSGTPCQLEGLLNYLRRPHDRLVTVDVVCRAVPSPLVLRKYLEMQRRRFDFTSVKFRDKSLHGYEYSCMSLGGGDREYREGIDTDCYLRAFFSGMSVRPACSACVFRPPRRRTDFTLWDCLDARRFDRRFGDGKGVTRVLVRTARAEGILRELSGELEMEEFGVEDVVKGVTELSLSHPLHPLRGDFFRDLAATDPEECFGKYFPVTARSRMEKLARTWSVRLGIYQTVKHAFLALNGGKSVKR